MDRDGKTGLADGIRCDEDGNVWAGTGWAGKGFEGVHLLHRRGVARRLGCQPSASSAFETVQLSATGTPARRVARLMQQASAPALSFSHDRE